MQITHTETAKVFKSGNSQAVRLPKEFRLNVDEVYISRNGSQLILEPKKESKYKTLGDLIRALPKIEDDFMEGYTDYPPESFSLDSSNPHKRKK